MATKEVISIKKVEEQHKKYLKQLYILLGIGCVLYYMLPFVFGIAVKGDQALWTKTMIMVLVGVYPLYTFMSCFVNTRFYGFKWFVPVLLGLYFVPAAMIFFGSTALLYTVVYIVIGYFGSLGAAMTVKRIEKQKNKKEKLLYEQREKNAGRRGKKS